jgi:nickel/cobalt exporter
MLQTDAFWLLVGAVALGAVHGIEPGHGWPVAAAYAMDQTNKWLYGFAASFILGVGHLLSSIAMVAVFFYAKSYFSLTQVNQPITIPILGGIQIGGPVSLVAGVLLIALGIREYYGGHSHGTGSSHSHTDHDEHDHGDAHDAHHHDEHDHDHTHDGDHDDHTHAHSDHAHSHSNSGFVAQLTGRLPFVGGHSHSHDHSHDNFDDAADRGLLGIAWFAFVLGFAHEEEFEIIAMCAGSPYCLELMSAYAVTVILGIVTLTLLLVAGYQRYEEKVERYTPYLPAFSAAVLIIIGIGFITGLF